jgi:hypothetical protein
MKDITPGLYRTTRPLPGHEEQMPAQVLVFVGHTKEGKPFVVRPGKNVKNRWFWGDPVLPLDNESKESWAESLRRLPREGFYTLPETLEFESGGRWPQNAIVQLGYDGTGRGILFVAEDREAESRNILFFATTGQRIEDSLLDRLVWAPILPVPVPPPPSVGLLN